MGISPLQYPLTKLFLHFIAVFEIYFVYLHAKYQANMRKLILLTFCIIFSAVSHADRLDSLYHAIDDVIKHADDYMLNKQQQLAELRQRVVQAKDDKIKYDATMALYEAYASFRNDSAVACLNRCINIADRHFARLFTKCLFLFYHILCRCFIRLQNTPIFSFKNFLKFF